MKVENNEEKNLLLSSEESETSKPEVFCTRRYNRKWWLKVSGVSCLITYLIGVLFMNIWITLTNRIVIQLYGDSLVDVSCYSHQLAAHLRDDFFYLQKSFVTEVNYFGKGGSRIHDLQRMLWRKVLHRFDYTTAFTWQYAAPPDAVILYWDSDVNPGPKDGSSPLNNQTVTAYLQTLHDVLETLISHCNVVILAGPTLSGELPRGQNALDEALDYYVQLNNATASSFNIPYINTRDLYFANLPLGWDQSAGYLTKDGEHPNHRGTRVLRSAFRKALMDAPLWKKKN